MKTISIIIIAIVISIALCTQINNKNKYLKSSSFLKAATNLDDCPTQADKDKFKKFAQPADTTYVLYNVDETKYSYINQNNIAIVEIQSAGAITKFKSIDYYTYTFPTISGTDVIANIVGTMKRHLEFDEAGTKLNDKTIFYEDGKEPETRYEKQLVNIGADGTPDVTTIQSTCTFIDYTAASPAKPVIATITEFFALDYAEGMVATGDRETTLTYPTISDKRMTKVDGTKYSTFYTKNKEICSISYDGVSKYSLYYSKYTADITFTGTPIFIIAEPEGTTFKSYILDCKGDSGSKECKKSDEGTTGDMKYTIVQSKTAPNPIYIFKSITYWGKSTATDKLSMEPAAIEEIAKIWDGCVINIEKVNNIGIYKYNIIILFIISLLYIL